MSVERKKGKLNSKERDFIRENIKLLSITQIADKLNRLEHTVRKFIINERLSEQYGQPSVNDIKAQILKSLQKKPFYKSLHNIFSPTEIGTFTEMWIDFVDQFGQDVLPSEELELKELLTYEILKGRILTEEKILIDRRNLYEESLKYMLKLSLSEQDREEIVSLEMRISSISETIDRKKKDFRELADKEVKVRASLYKKRTDRTEDLNKAKIDFTAQIKLLQDPDVRREIATAMEIMAVAADKEREKMSEYYQFADGKLDQLLLNAESAAKIN